MFFAGWFKLSQSSPPVRNATYLQTFHFRIYWCLSRDFVNQHVFFAARFALRQPKTPVKNATNVLKTIIMPFRRLFVLWHSLIRSLYFIYTSDTFRPLHQFFPMCVTTRNIFLIPNDAVARNLIIVYNVYNFSCQRPHLNYLFFLTFIVLIQVNFSWNVRDEPLENVWGGGGGRRSTKKIFAQGKIY